ncbi:hypothetical protein KC19_3G234000 [Ceratodon purpureus]|uniref:PH domain-containing protein n=1 Tax=Ceratodon purpureus TaxID=3225 RepID=A0A8T0ILX9_CERPU|nr:hypothetical protein KC19_3G234000 [Ceratodon purpureus]
MHSLCCIAPAPVDKGGRMFPTSSEPGSPTEGRNGSVSRSSMAASKRGAMEGVEDVGVGKVFTVTPEGGMKTATNFSGELFQVVDTKAGASPPGSALTDNVAGILYKWVNYGKGWRPRWFALKDGVFSYYKVHGHDKVTVSHHRFKSYRIIGEEAQKLMKKQTHRGSHPHAHPHVHVHSSGGDRGGGGGGDHSQFRASGEIHLKVSSLRNSQSDDKKFYIYTGTKTLHLRAESSADRQDWYTVLKAAKDLFPRNSHYIGLVTPSEEITISTDKLRQKLVECGLSEEKVKECEDVMLAEFSDVKEQLRVMQQRRISLLERLRLLEAEKVELETTVVDEMQSQSGGGGLHGLKKYYGGSDTESDEDTDSHKGGIDGDSDDEDEVFFEARDTLRKSANSQRQHSESPSHSEVDMDIVGFDYPKVARRKVLPDPKEKEKSVSLWSMIKDNIGKDLTKVCLPVYFNEPISSLQRCFEDVEYSYLLDKAAEYGKRGNSLMRLLCIGAFAVSGYASTEGRTCKPFNPLLGETYEADYPDKGLRFCSEKVSHHPMIVACHCEGRGWKFWGDSNLKSKFWGRSIQLDPVGILTLKFDDGEVFQWTKVTTSIYNLILGKLYVDHYGTMRIQGNRELSVKLKFKEQSIIDRNPHQVQGFVHDRSGAKIATLFGKWDEAMYYVMGDLSEKPKHYDPMSEALMLWRCADPPEKPTRYGLTAFATTLNEITPGLKEKLPPTDSRLRPDQRHLESGEFDAANVEKLRLEQKQRRARTLQESGWQPRWFRKGKGKDTYEYIGGYWEARDKGRWDGCPDIFGPDPLDENGHTE